MREAVKHIGTPDDVSAGSKKVAGTFCAKQMGFHASQEIARCNTQLPYPALPKDIMSMSLPIRRKVTAKQARMSVLLSR
jgi:hypothetical protein